jgi:hypothetical protein
LTVRLVKLWCVNTGQPYFVFADTDRIAINDVASAYNFYLFYFFDFWLCIGLGRLSRL